MSNVHVACHNMLAKLLIYTIAHMEYNTNIRFIILFLYLLLGPSTDHILFCNQGERLTTLVFEERV